VELRPVQLVYETQDAGSLIGFMSNPLPIIFNMRVLAEPLGNGIDQTMKAKVRRCVEGRLAKSDGTPITGLQVGERLTLRCNRGANLDIEITDSECGFVLLRADPMASEFFLLTALLHAAHP
jgi:hypothetical protein